MSVATICLAIACVLPILCAGLAKRGGIVNRSFDNHAPRAWLAKQEGAAARANAAQQNSWEALAIFGPAVLSAQLGHAPHEYVNVLALAFVVLRVVYVGMFGSFAAVILDRWGDDGIGILLGGIVAAVAYDVGGLFIGRAAGRSPLSAASPNKTVEGLIGGMALCVVASTVIVSLWEPWGSWKHGFALGVAAAIAAPLGDLCESLLKRDLGVKDMGAILPGHGGLLDRFDAMLFVLPVTYEVARLLELI